MNYTPALRSALMAQIGNVLTPEVAAMIELQCRPFVREIPSFEPQHYKECVFAVEKFADIEQEIHPLHEAHYAETEKYRAGIPMNPDYALFKRCEMFGSMVQFTMRHNGSLVGNIRMYLFDSTHTQTVVAKEDTFFILPDHRKGFTAIRFWQYMESCMMALNVREIETDSKITNNVHRLNEYLGYSHVANKFVKTFKE